MLICKGCPNLQQEDWGNSVSPKSRFVAPEVSTVWQDFSFFLTSGNPSPYHILHIVSSENSEIPLCSQRFASCRQTHHRNLLPSCQRVRALRHQNSLHNSCLAPRRLRKHPWIPKQVRCCEVATLNTLTWLLTHDFLIISSRAKEQNPNSKHETTRP